MRVWVSFVGRRRAAVCNTVWAADRKGVFHPDKVVLIHTEETKSVACEAGEKLRVVVEGVEVELVEVEDRGGLPYFREVAERIVGGAAAEGCEVAVDVGPGRKPMSIAILLAALKHGAKAYYLHLKDNSYSDVDYPLIPLPLQRLEEVSLGP